jgi:lincosamide nucleotidyltransferase
MMVAYRVSPEIGNEALNALFDASWPEHTPSDFMALHRHSLAYVCAFAGDVLVGYVNIAWDGAVHAFLLDTTVAPAWRKRGIGRELVQCAVTTARARGIQWLHVDYEPGLTDFYRRCGFRHTEAGLIWLGSESTAARAESQLPGAAAGPQPGMIERLRGLCQEDARVVAATLYGSFATGEADAYSDVECVLYFTPGALANLDRAAWVEQIAPVVLFFPDDFGHYTAIFENLVRGEFHFEPEDAIGTVANWRGSSFFPDPAAAVLVDRTGALTAEIARLDRTPPERDAPEAVTRLAANLANGVLFGSQVLARGEEARALEILVFTLRYVEWLARLAARTTAHWPTPSRRLEWDLPPEDVARLRRCTARLDRAELRDGYRNAWEWGRALAETLAARHGVTLPIELYERITERVRIRG